MTFAQLQSFAAVARLGSVRAAALELGVTEPSISGAMASLRRDLGDELYVRAGGGIRLTPGGRRLAAAADEILGLVDQARRNVHEAGGDVATLRVAVGSDVAELAATPLLEAFARRQPGLHARVGVAGGRTIAELLSSRRADVGLGPRASGPGVECVPFLRYALAVIAAPGHRLAGHREIAPAALAGERWLTGPAGSETATATGAFLSHRGIEAEAVRALDSHAAVRAAVAAGGGLALAVAHAAAAERRRGDLAVLDVRGTPLHGLWFASTLGHDRRSAAADALRRFVTTPEATQAMLAGTQAGGGERFRPAIHVTLWS